MAYASLFALFIVNQTHSRDIDEIHAVKTYPFNYVQSLVVN